MRHKAWMTDSLAILLSLTLALTPCMVMAEEQVEGIEPEAESVEAVEEGQEAEIIESEPEDDAALDQEELPLDAQADNADSWYKTAVDFTDENGNPQSQDSVRIIGEDASNTLTTGWYVVGPYDHGGLTQTFSKRVEIQGDVNIILCDGAKLTFDSGVHLTKGNSLTIWNQRVITFKNDTTKGYIYARSRDKKWAAVGGNDGEDGGTFIVHGGYFHAAARVEDGACVGGGYKGNGGTAKIYGGTVDLHAVDGSALGGGAEGDGGEVYIYGGFIDILCNGGEEGKGNGAGIGGGDDGGNGGYVEISGGDVVSECDIYGAGIGGGENGNGGTVKIAGGKVLAIGGGEAAGIGSGRGCKNGDTTIEITGGEVEAHGSNAGLVDYLKHGAGIGGGRGGWANITISGKDAVVTAVGANETSPSIGNGYEAEGASTITIKDGATVYATGGRWAAGIGGARGAKAAGTINISGEGTYVEATGGREGAGIGGGDGNPGHNVYIDDKATVVASGKEGAMAIGAGEGNSTPGVLDLQPGSSVMKGADLVQAQERLTACRTTSGAVRISPCEHANAKTVYNETAHWSFCEHCLTEKPNYGEHEYGDGLTCNVCGYSALDTPLEAQVYGHTLTLNGEIGFNTYVLFRGDVSKSDYRVMLYDESGKLVSAWGGNFKHIDSVVKKETIINGIPCTVYGFSIDTVAKGMFEKYTLKISRNGTPVDFAGIDSVPIPADEGLKYSVMDYLDEMIAFSSSEEMGKLAEDMKAYGIYAKHYFDVRDGGIKEELPSIAGFEVIRDLGVSYSAPSPKSIDHFTYVGTTLDLLSNTSFRMYFNSDDVDVLTIKFGDMVLKPVEKDSMYYVELAGIAAKDLDNMYDITISNGARTVTAYHGPLGYGQWAVTSSTNQNLQYLMMALHHYNQSADAYFSH